MILERSLVNNIVSHNKDFLQIDKLEDHSKEQLKEHIQQAILTRYDYQPLEHIEEMIEKAIEAFEDDLLAINYISDIHYTIDDYFYEKLKEPYYDSYDDTIIDWDEEFEKDNKNIKLNQWTLTDWIKFEVTDAMDLTVKEFYKADFWKKIPASFTTPKSTRQFNTVKKNRQ